MISIEDREPKDFEHVSGPNNEVMLAVTCAAAPTQIEGFAYGKYVYFRERHGHWGFWVSDVSDSLGKEPVLGAQCPEFMLVDDAMALVKALISIYVEPR